MIAGIKNSVIEQDVIPIGGEKSATGEDYNFAGNAFTTTETVLEKESAVAGGSFGDSIGIESDVDFF